MKVYIVQHFTPGFCGVVMGVDFYDGRGSTSSASDVVLLVKEGCTLPDPAARAEIRVLAADMARVRQTGEASRALQDAFERTPEYTVKALARMEEKKRADPKFKQQRLLEKQLRRHSGVRIKKIK
ncbi:MAG: hypothetical protein IMZ57_11845 [Acidobacteria bacterium]|nr:hypothetical protein [Acidobacteriota bacterium]